MNAKIIGLILVALPIFNFAFAGVSIEKAKSFFKEKRPCKFAIVTTSNGEISDIVRPSTFCVFDSITDRGTINEVRGCAVSYYDPDVDRYFPLLKQSSLSTMPFVNTSFTLSTGKLCDKDTVVELLTSAKRIETFKSSLVGQYLKAHDGNYKNIYELYLQMTPSLIKNLSLVYDEYEIGDLFCSKKPCTTFDHAEEVAHIKEDPADIERQKKFKEEQRQAEQRRIVGEQAAKEKKLQSARRLKKQNEIDKKNREVAYENAARKALGEEAYKLNAGALAKSDSNACNRYCNQNAGNPKNMNTCYDACDRKFGK